MAGSAIALALGLPADLARPDAAAAQLDQGDRPRRLCVHTADAGAVGEGLMLQSYASGIGAGLAAPGRPPAVKVLVALTSSLYGPLQSVAMARPIHGLCHTPHVWAKTHHVLHRPSSPHGQFYPASGLASLRWRTRITPDTMPDN
ncbi:hypothetical protein [Hyphomonas sp.]|mgnify:CR=1 FL=1|uniref:hypothetical protein n=2 Tax=Hyphomonas sp. TaxID=87 RepID=UPI003D2B0945